MIPLPSGEWPRNGSGSEASEPPVRPGLSDATDGVASSPPLLSEGGSEGSLALNALVRQGGILGQALRNALDDFSTATEVKTKTLVTHAMELDNRSQELRCQVVVEEDQVTHLRRSLEDVCSLEQLQELQAQVDVDCKAASHAQDVTDTKGAEARSYKELLRADVHVLDNNCGITEDLRSQMRESQGVEADLQR